MTLRSLLFVPGDRPDRMHKALGLDADALILDLEDSVSPAMKPTARHAIMRFTKDRGGKHRLLVRINPLDGPDVAADLAMIMEADIDGVMLPKSEGAESIRALTDRLNHHGRPLPILPIATETPVAIFGLGTYRDVASSLLGLTWGAEDLSSTIGASASRVPDGGLTAPLEMARSMTLFAAHAARVPAIETVYANFRDLDGLELCAARARRDGFTGMMAIHPAQIPVINAAFSPSPDEIAHARAVVAAFAQNPAAGALQIGGRMIDAPHLKQARRLLDAIGPQRAKA